MRRPPVNRRLGVRTPPTPEVIPAHDRLPPMTGSQDIRWKQHFENFDKAFTLLADALKRGPAGLSLLEKEGVIQRFEYSFELGWKTLKDYLEAGGLVITPVTPRQVLKEAFAAKVIDDGQAWIDMLDHRNLLAHTYDSSTFENAVDAIAERYLDALANLHRRLAGDVGDAQASPDFG
jgi:nucleotidyltransferase substrate binding protein (TIGR01987 family)